MNIKGELVNLMYESQMGNITDEEAVDALAGLQIRSGLTESQFLVKITKIVTDLTKEK